MKHFFLVVILLLVGCGKCYTDKNEECEDSKSGKVITKDKLNAHMACRKEMSELSILGLDGANAYESIKKDSHWYKQDKLDVYCKNYSHLIIIGDDWSNAIDANIKP